MHTDVFIAHGLADEGLAADACRALERGGLRCWISPRDAPVGKGYAQHVSEAIGHASTFLFVLSVTSRTDESALRQIQVAIAKRRPVIVLSRGDVALPSTLSESAPADMLEVCHNAISGQQWQTLLSKVRALLPQPAQLDVFFSYAIKEDREWVVDLSSYVVDILASARLGRKLLAWSDRAECEPEIPYATKVINALNEATVIVIVLSPDYFRSEVSKNEWKLCEDVISRRRAGSGKPVRVLAVYRRQLDAHQHLEGSVFDDTPRSFYVTDGDGSTTHELSMNGVKESERFFEVAAAFADDLVRAIADAEGRR